MSCAKQTVIAIIENNGKYWIGSNWCKKPQKECPRKDMPTGQGYELCEKICEQSSHAEIDACRNAGGDAEGGTMYIIGHTYCCDNCKRVCNEIYGIKEIKINEYPIKLK